MTRTPRHSGAFQSASLHLLALAGIIALILALPASPAFAQGKGGGGGSGGGGSTAPADPAIAFGIGSSSLAVMNDDGSNIQTVLTGAQVVWSRAVWSPDLDGDASNGYQGTLAFLVDDGAGADEVWLCDVRIIDGTPTALRARQVGSSAWLFGGVSWSPDLDPVTPGYQGLLVYVMLGEDVNTDPDIIVGIPVGWDGNHADPSTVHSAVAELIFSDAVNTPYIDTVAWSQDGTRLVFEGIGGETRGLVILDDLSNPEPRLVVSAVEFGGGGMVGFQPEWSRTGNTIIFRGDGWLWTIDADEPQTTMTNLGIRGSSPTWAPDDSAIVFHTPTGGGNTNKIVKYDFNTQTSTILAGHNRQHYRNPHWRPF